MLKYKNHLKSIKLQTSTIKSYLWHIDQFLSWLDKAELTDNKLKEYFQYLLKKYKRINTINLRLKIINNYLKFLNTPFHIDLLPNETTGIKILTAQELDKFLENPNKYKNLIGLRDKAILELLYSSGLKVGQLVKLKISQIDAIKQEIFITKNNFIKINPSTWLYLKKYLDKRNDTIDYLFINFDRSNKSDNRSLSIRSVERLINKYAKNINPSVNINPQILRNTLAHRLKSEGAQSEHIKSALHFKTKIAAQNYLNKI
ncbi:MAG: tyrosine-type recombinase/integrase [Patescibacteria group bacterium]|jgi:site-specific recombinase XerD